MEASIPNGPTFVQVRPATIGWRARASLAVGHPRDERSHWRPTRRWAARAAAREVHGDDHDLRELGEE